MTAKVSEKTGFDTLKVNEGNRKALEAARAVVGGSADGNPLVLIGQEGAGKTTLLQAIVEGVAAQKDGRRVLTLTMGKFRPHYIAAKKACALRRFRERMRDAEVLIVDEFETAGLGCLIQEELIALMTSYLYAGKQLVIASAVPLSQIHGSSRELFDRHYPGMRQMFEGGHRMNADVVNRVLIPFIRTKGLL